MFRRSSIALATALALVATAPPLLADAPKGHATGAGGPPELQSTNPEVVQRALDELRMEGPKAGRAVLAIVARLRAGLPPTLAAAAIDTLGDIGSTAASEVLAEYVEHRLPDIRGRAVVALMRTRGAPAVPALRHALADIDPKVRGLAAAALGHLPAGEAVPELFLALARQVPEAAESIGLLCSAKECEQLMGLLGHLPLTTLKPGIDAMLFRPVSEVTEEAKIKIVWSLREFGTAEAHRYLEDVKSRFPKGQARTLSSIDQAIAATALAPNAGSIR